jgi:hypothetical protein
MLMASRRGFALCAINPFISALGLTHMPLWLFALSFSRAMKMKTHDLKKLPKWAQIRIEKLEDDLAFRKEKLSEATGECGYKSTISWEVGMMKYHLPENARVFFEIDDSKVEVKKAHYPSGIFLDVHTPGGALSVTPVVMNRVRIGIGRF